MTQKEFEKIYNEAYRAVYWTSMSLLRNEADAEDIVQDTFVTLIGSYESIKDKDKVIPWLKKTAANKCLNRLTRTRTEVVEDEFFENVEAVAEDFLPDSIVESEDARRIIMDIINNSLSEDIRRTLILFYFDEMSTKETAEALGVPEGTVRRRLNFARNKIKKEVEKYEEDNDTKLFAMVIPFLTKLFIKESEQVTIKPIPASLIKLSASAEVSSKGAAIKATAGAVKKGTGIMMKTKILIGVAAAVVAVGVTTGVILGVMNRKDDRKDKGTRDTDIRQSGQDLEYVDDREPEEDEGYEEEDTKTSHVITEDSIYMCLDGMTTDELVENFWKTGNVYDGMNKDEYYERLIYPEEDEPYSTDSSFSWDFSPVLSGGEKYIGSLSVFSTVSCPEVFKYDDEFSMVKLYVFIESPEEREELTDKLIAKYLSEGFTVTDDTGPDNGTRLVYLSGYGRQFKIIDPGYNFISIDIPIVCE